MDPKTAFNIIVQAIAEVNANRRSWAAINQAIAAIEALIVVGTQPPKTPTAQAPVTSPKPIKVAGKAKK